MPDVHQFHRSRVRIDEKLWGAREEAPNRTLEVRHETWTKHKSAVNLEEPFCGFQNVLDWVDH
jgi:hypothetical protein